MNEKEQLEATSSLIKACKGIGATYHKDKIVLADGTAVALEDLDTFWRFNWARTWRDLGKHYSVKLLSWKILEIHIKILQEKA